MNITATHDGGSAAPWPCPAPPPVPAHSAWPGTRLVSLTPPATNALTPQLKASNVFKKSFLDSDSDDDSGGDSDEEEADHWSDLGAKKFQLFLKVFVEDGGLRRYFEENHKAGEFFCFVCGGIGKKGSGKTYKSCLGLLQHVAAASRTERNQSHQALGMVICRVLGWDFDKIPAVVPKGEPLSRTLGDNVEIVKKIVGVPSDNGDGLVEIEGSAGKGHVECKGGRLCRDTESSIEIGTENEATNQPCSEAMCESVSIDQPLARLGISQGELRENSIRSKDGLDFSKNDPGSFNHDENGETALEKDSGIHRDDTSVALNLQGFKQPVPEWPFGDAAAVNSPSAMGGWPVLAPKLASAPSSLSAEEQAMLAVDQLQHKAIKLCKEFFGSSSSLDSDGDEEDSSEDSYYENEDADSPDDSKELNFFSELFSEDVKLREFYSRSSHGARDFCCLVCGGIGKKEWKRFTGVALLQHSTAISKTRKKRAHRAYGQVISRVLGQDRPSPESCDSQGEVDDTNDGVVKA